jgi:hypothetical protein
VLAVSDKLIATALLFVVPFGSAFSTTKTEPVQRFTDFPVREIYRGKPAPAQPTSRFAHRFRTVIRKGAQEGPNFAGHYTVVIWGCGTSCAQFAIVDAVTGETYDPPFDGITWGDEKGFLKQYGLHFRLDSSLFVAQGCPEEKNCAARYYEWKDNSFVLLNTEPVERFPPPSPEPPTITVKRRRYE